MILLKINIFNYKICVWALLVTNLYGMSVKEFWEEDPDLFWAYRFSYIERIKFENEDKNGTN